MRTRANGTVNYTKHFARQAAIISDNTQQPEQIILLNFVIISPNFMSGRLY